MIIIQINMDKQKRIPGMLRRDFLKALFIGGLSTCLPTALTSAQSDNTLGSMDLITMRQIERGYRGMPTMVIENYEPPLMDLSATLWRDREFTALLEMHQNGVLDKLYGFYRESGLLKGRPLLLLAGEFFPLRHPDKKFGNPLGLQNIMYRNKMNLIGGIKNFHPAEYFLRESIADRTMTSQDWINWVSAHELGHFIHLVYPKQIKTENATILTSSDTLHPSYGNYPLPNGEHTDIYPLPDLMGGRGGVSNQGIFTPLTLFLMGLMTENELDESKPYFLRGEENLYFTSEDLLNSLDDNANGISVNQYLMSIGVEKFKPAWMLDQFGKVNEDTGRIEVVFDLLPIVFRGNVTEDMYKPGDDIEEYLEYFYKAAEYVKDVWDRSTNGKVKINIVTI